MIDSSIASSLPFFGLVVGYLARHVLARQQVAPDNEKLRGEPDGYAVLLLRVSGDSKVRG